MMQEPTEVTAILPCLFNLLFAVVLLIIMPVAVYRYYRKECDCSSGKSFGFTVVAEISFIFLTIAYFEIMLSLIGQIGNMILRDIVVVFALFVWFALPFAILWRNTVKIRKARKDESEPQSSNEE